jgi:hypothetical protein
MRLLLDTAEYPGAMDCHRGKLPARRRVIPAKRSLRECRRVPGPYFMLLEHLRAAPAAGNRSSNCKFSARIVAYGTISKLPFIKSTSATH